MNYKKIYENFIENRKKRNPILGYKENHHIQPKSLGGTDEDKNIVALSARDHYFAHRLLAKIYGGPMHIAIHRMAHPRAQGSDKRKKVTSREYEVLKKNRSEALSKIFKGVPRDEVTKKNISASLKGRVLTEEWKRKISISQTGMKKRPMSDKQKKQISERMRGHRNHRFGKPSSSAQKKATSLSNSGEKSHRYDSTIYKFIHRNGCVRECTKYELRKEFKINHGNLSMLCSGKRKSVQGWMIDE